MEETQFKEAFRLLGLSFKVVGIRYLKASWKGIRWCLEWIVNHKLITALILSMAANTWLMVAHMQDAYGREHQNYVYWQLEEKYDSVRMANIKWHK